MKKIFLLLFILLSVKGFAQTDLWGGRTATQGKTFLSLNLVENTALSTWAGTANITTLGTVSTGTWSATTIGVSKGGTGVATLALNGVLYGNAATSVLALAVNSTATNKFLTQSSSNAPAWATIVAGDLPTIDVAHYGTGVATMTTAYAPVISGTTATGNLQVASTGLATSGYVLTSNGASAVPSFQAVPSSISYSTITADQTAAVNNFYFTNKAATRCVVTLPTATIGQHVMLCGDPVQGTLWKLAQPATTKIYWSGNATTAGTGGYIQSNSAGDFIDVVFQKNDGTNDIWFVVGAQGQLTVN